MARFQVSNTARVHVFFNFPALKHVARNFRRGNYKKTMKIPCLTLGGSWRNPFNHASSYVRPQGMVSLDINIIWLNFTIWKSPPTEFCLCCLRTRSEIEWSDLKLSGNWGKKHHVSCNKFRVYYKEMTWPIKVNMTLYINVYIYIILSHKHFSQSKDLAFSLSLTMIPREVMTNSSSKFA